MKKDGIYFGLSEDEYFAENRIGSTLLRTLIDAPAKFWFDSYLNPLKKEKNKKCLNDGKIFHKILLEGNDSLYADFAIIPSNMHSASKEFKAWKSQQIRPIIKAEDVKQAQQVLSHLTQRGSVLSNFFADGYPEVSILWTDDKGYKRAARIDYLKIGQLIDVKSFENWETENESKYFWKYKVFVQLIDYINALKAARTLPVVKGTAKQKAFWKECAQIDEWLPWVCFVNREYPQYKLKTMEKSKCPDIYKLGNKMIAKAIENLESYLDKYGASHAWIDEPTPDSLQFQDTDFPQLMSYEI